MWICARLEVNVSIIMNQGNVCWTEQTLTRLRGNGTAVDALTGARHWIGLLQLNAADQQNQHSCFCKTICSLPPSRRCIIAAIKRLGILILNRKKRLIRVMNYWTFTRSSEASQPSMCDVCRINPRSLEGRREWETTSLNVAREVESFTEHGFERVIVTLGVLWMCVVL